MYSNRFSHLPADVFEGIASQIEDTSGKSHYLPFGKTKATSSHYEASKTLYSFYAPKSQPDLLVEKMKAMGKSVEYGIPYTNSFLP